MPDPSPAALAFAEKWFEPGVNHSAKIAALDALLVAARLEGAENMKGKAIRRVMDCPSLEPHSRNELINDLEDL